MLVESSVMCVFNLQAVLCANVIYNGSLATFGWSPCCGRVFFLHFPTLLAGDIHVMRGHAMDVGDVPVQDQLLGAGKVAVGALVVLVRTGLYAARGSRFRGFPYRGEFVLRDAGSKPLCICQFPSQRCEMYTCIDALNKFYKQCKISFLPISPL